MGRQAYRGCAAVAALALAACSTGPGQAPAPVEERLRAPPAVAPATITRPGARWVAVPWADLPGWSGDRTREAWVALQRGCERPTPEAQRAWQRVCAEALRHLPPDDASTRAWLEQRLVPYRVLPLEGASNEGLATGYYEPQLDAQRRPGPTHRVPLYAPPADLATRKPWFTRAQIELLPAAQAALRGREIAYVADPVDALVLQIQGSGRLRITEVDGRVSNVRLSYAGTNDHPYVSVGRWLIDQGELRSGDASWPAIREWTRRHPQRVAQLLAANPRYVFFKEEPLSDPGLGPRGTLGVSLVAERSIAVDNSAIPLGTPVWLDTTEPLASTPLRRLVLAQDTGSAITGAVRADYFWGWGERAELQAGRMKQPLRMWVLWPK
jgi:membrane-bound lytic murein transglycosylase A